MLFNETFRMSTTPANVISLLQSVLPREYFLNVYHVTVIHVMGYW